MVTSSMIATVGAISLMSRSWKCVKPSIRYKTVNLILGRVWYRRFILIVLLLKEINGIFAFQRYTKNAYSNGAPHAGIRNGCLFCFSQIKNVYLNKSDISPSIKCNLFSLKRLLLWSTRRFLVNQICFLSLTYYL